VIVLLDGHLTVKIPSSCVVNVNGIGYEVNVPLMIKLPQIGERVRLWIHAIYREDHQSLYGFNLPEERDFFKLVVEKVSGIGPKMALAMFSKFTLNELCHSIATKDVSSLTNIPGIGRKTAEKVMLELSDKISNTTTQSIVGGVEHGIRSDAILGLAALGYKRQEAESIVNQILKQDPDIKVDQLIKKAITR
jgi:Holliday junction DNA helicase RuvA